MWRALCCLWMLSLLSLFHWAGADDDFCNRPINMDLCWWTPNMYKRYLRFGRGGDPFLRFGKRLASPEALDNGGYLRFGRSLSSPQQVAASPFLALLTASSPEGSSSSGSGGSGDGGRKKRDVSAMTSSRIARDVQDGGFLRFGRNNNNNNNNNFLGEANPEARASMSLTNGPRALKRNSVNLDLPNGDREYLRFGRARLEGGAGFGKRAYLRFGRTIPEAYLRFGKRSMGTA
ncbi:uncharacterized protein LOC143286428 isoform X2 [Babylonia areolata]|uniref:uncharacterized protein LOC143286428 isoform X2 n=1 Tax=Babylonia areolata TaxID=304850 RepID=UPI003FD3DAF3